MSLEEDLYLCLESINGGLSALVAPQNASEPYSVYQVIADIKTNVLIGQCDMPQIRFQIDTYTDDLFEVKAIQDDISMKLLAYTDFHAIIYQTLVNVTDEGNTIHGVTDFKLIK